MTPAQVDDCSPFQFAAAIAGWNACHGAKPKNPPPMSRDRFRELVDKYG